MALVGLEVWSDSDKCPVTQDPFATLHEFLDWRKVKLLPQRAHDNAQLIRWERPGVRSVLVSQLRAVSPAEMIFSRPAPCLFALVINGQAALWLQGFQESLFSHRSSWFYTFIFPIQHESSGGFILTMSHHFLPFSFKA